MMFSQYQNRIRIGRMWRYLVPLLVLMALFWWWYGVGGWGVLLGALKERVALLLVEGYFATQPDTTF